MKRKTIGIALFVLLCAGFGFAQTNVRANNGTLTGAAPAGTINNTCSANQQAGADLGAKINNCLALGNGTDILISAAGTISTQILINNLNDIRIEGISTGGAVSLANAITGTNAGCAIKITGTSQHIVLEDIEIDGNNLTGVRGNGNGICIVGTGATPAQIYLNRAGSQFNKGTGVDGTGAAIASSGLYVYKSIDIWIDGGFFGANQQGITLDNAVNNVTISRAGIFRNVKSAILSKNGVSHIVVGPGNDMEGNGTLTSDFWINMDGCQVCSVWGNWLESNSGDMLFSTNTQGCQLDFYDNVVLHGGNGSSPNTNIALDGGASCDLEIHDNYFTMLQTMTSIIDINPSSNAAVGKVIRNNIFDFITGSVTLNAINWQAGTSAGKCIIEGNSAGSAFTFTGTTAFDVSGGTIGCRVHNNSCSTSSGTLTNCVKVETGASNTFVSNTTTSGAGTITNVFADSGTNTTCVGQGCAATFTTSQIKIAGATTFTGRIGTGVNFASNSAVQTYFFGCSGTATASQTLFLFAPGSNILTCTDITGFGTPIIATAGTLVNLRCHAYTGGLDASSGVFTLMDNSVAQALTCTMGTGTTCNDTTHTVSVRAGDAIGIRYTTQAAETLANIQCSVEKY